MSLFVATPCFGGQVNVYFMESIINLICECSKNKIQCQFFHIPFESLIPRARNVCASAFLKSKATHLLFVDADIQFNAADVIRMIKSDCDVIGGSYPTKNLNVKNFKNEYSMNELIARNVQYTSKGVHTGHDLTKMECDHIATGFMLIKRNVFDKIIVEHPEIRYINDIPAYAEHTQNGGVLFDFFQSTVVNGRYMSEDYGFCELWKTCNGKIYTDLTCKLNHIGNFTYYGNPIFKLKQ